MARRIDIELTSKREDDTWTWRAAGAREPKGTLESKLVPPEAKAGDVLKVEVEGFLDGLSIIAVVPQKSSRREPERIELLTPRTEGSLVTTHLARKPRRDDDRRGDRRRRDGDRDRGGDRGGDRDRRGPRSDRGDRGAAGGGGGGPRGERGDRDRDRDRRDRRERPSTPPPDLKPKPKRLRPARAHRAALLEALPAEQRPIAEQLLQGGIPAVRQAIEKQNETLKAEGKSQVAAEPLMEIAEKLRHKAQAAVWRDRADAALAAVDDLDLRDLRSVVNAADDAGRDQEARAVADQLREALANRVEKEQSAWVAEVAENLQEGRVVRALRLSSRPPKAGSPLPGNLAEELITITNAALTADTGPQRWATVLDALAYSPIRRRVVPDSLPEKLPADLREVISKLGSRLPEIAHIFAIEPAEAPGRPRPPRRKGGKPEGGRGDGDRRPKGKKGDRPEKGEKADKGPKPEAKAAPDAETEAAEAAPVTEAQDAVPSEATDTPAAETTTDAPATDVETTDAPATDVETTDAPATDVEDTVTPEAAEADEEAGEPTEAMVEEAAESPAPEAEAEAPVETTGEPTEAMVDEAEPKADDEVTADDEGSVEATASA